MSSYHNQTIAYRPEIDGLRAIAVMPVILFHAGFELFSGGYVGVDVFFVISGYLITSIILREMEQGKFSIVRFYERRARRILPALFFVIACCLPFAWIWMLPDELKRFGQSLVAVATFSSNIYFWRKTDYFAPAAEEQPLLHTWSLAVEEQYYVLFPLFLMLCWRFGKSKVFWLTVTSAALSLLLAEWAWRNQPVANFYLLPTRAWELLAGSLIAFIPRDLAEKAKTHQASQFYSAVGLLMIVYSILFFDSDTPFPSAYAIVPVLGSVILIVYTNGTGVVGSFLASKPIVGIGLISYSAYLWHQPIFAFLRLNYLYPPSQIQFAVGALASLALAYLTWRLVEQPARNQQIQKRSIFQLSGAGLTVVLGMGLALMLSQGFQNRFDPAAIPPDWKGMVPCHGAKEAAKFSNPIYTCLGETRNQKPNDLFLIGDSHAAQLTFPLSEIARESGSNLYFLNLENPANLPYSLWNSNLEEFKRGNIVNHLFEVLDEGDVVILTFHRGHLNSKRDLHLSLALTVHVTEKERQAAENLEWFVSELAIRKTRLALISDVPLLPSSKLTLCYLRQDWRSCSIRKEQDIKTRTRMERIFLEMEKKFPDSVVKVDINDEFFDSSGWFVPYSKTDGFLYFDAHHITEAKARKLKVSLQTSLSDLIGN